MEETVDGPKEDLSSLTCSICFDWYDQPRKLPLCSHLFCERCLFLYVSKSKEEVDNGIKCPVCRQFNPAPDTGQDVMEWVQTLELDTKLAEKMNTDLKERKAHLCTGCRQSKKITIAVRFCFDCHEYFCNTCCDFIHAIKAFIDHSLINVDVESEVLNENTQDLIGMMMKCMTCAKHPEKPVAFLCRDNDRLCCASCAFGEQKNDKNLLEITSFTSKEKNDSNAYGLLEQFERVITLSESVIAKKRDMESVEKKETDRIMTEIRDVRRKVNEIFDSLEENLLQECKAATKRHTLDSIEDIEKLRDTIKSIKEYENLLEKSTQQGSVQVVYAIIHNLQKKLKDTGSFVLEIKHKCKQYGFELQLKDPLKHIVELGTNDTKSLAHLAETERPVMFPVIAVKHRLMLPVCEMIKDGMRTKEFNNDLITGMACISNKRLIIVDNSANSHCCLANADCKVLAQCKIGDQRDHVETDRSAFMKDGTSYTEFCEYRPNSIAYLHNNTATVNICALKKLIFLTTDEPFKIVSEIHTQYKPFALCGLGNGDLAVAWKDPWAFGILSFSRYRLYEEIVYIEQDKNGRKFETFRFLAIDERKSHVIQPCIIDQAVYCFDFQGNPVFTYTNEKLVFPQGVAVDMYGNIYVCDSRTSCIHVLSPSGLGLSMISEKDKLYWPIAVAVALDSSELTVAYGKARWQFVSTFQLRYTQN